MPLSHLFESLAFKWQRSPTLLHCPNVLSGVSVVLCEHPESMRSGQGSSERAEHGDVIRLIRAPLLQYPSLSDPLSLKQGAIVSDPSFLLLLLNGWAMLKTKACVCLPKVSVFKLPHNGCPVFTLQWTEVYQSGRKLVCLEGVMANITFSHNRFIKVTITLGKQDLMLSWVLQCHD